MLAIAAVILAARLVGALIARLSQPRVMGEVLAGILLGPTLLGAVWPEAKDYLFPPDIVPLLAGAAQIGLAFYLFLVGMELDPKILRDRIGQAAFISNASVAFPLGLGFLVALPVYELLSPGRALPALRALHGRRDVRDRLPRARADPDRAADAEAAGRRAVDGGRRDRRRDGVVPARARGGDRRQRRPVARAPGRRAGRRSSARRCCSSAGGSSDASRRPTTRSAACRRCCSASSSSACCSRRSSPSRSGSQRSSAPS